MSAAHAPATAFWRRIDTPGHDACRLDGDAAGWHLNGAALFREGGRVARLSYTLACDTGWGTTGGLVRGWLGDEAVDFTIERTAQGVWSLNGEVVGELHGLKDLDYGFTPATNLPQIHRIALKLGESADVPVAWFNVSDGTLSVLPQRYERRTSHTYWYEAPRFGYTAELVMGPDGFVLSYPDLWEAERLLPER